MKQTIKLLSLSLLAAALFTFVKTSAAHAATLNPTTGSDELNTNSNCSLSEAITNINNGNDTSYPECTNSSADPYGTYDTIILPSGTVTLVANLPSATTSVIIEGQGMGQTTIDGVGAWQTISAESNQQKTLTVNGLTIKAFNRVGIAALDLDTDLNINQVEIDGTGSTTDMPLYAGMLFVASGNSQISNVYVHDIVSGQSGLSVTGIGMAGGQGSVGTVTLSNATVANIGNTSDGAAQGIGLATGVIDGSNTPATLTLNLSNSTVTNVHSAANNATGVNFYGVVDSGADVININARNNTITNVHGATNVAKGGALSFVGGAIQSGANLTLNYTSQNNLYAANDGSGEPVTCESFNGNSLIPGTGTVTFNFASDGGNVTEDDTCSSYFNQASDQNNVANLSSTLGALANNGGMVPTIALQDSPAIDAGVNSGLSTDARGNNRPQGVTYDAGAYESSYRGTADLKVEKKLLTDGVIKQGDTLTYQITIKNVGSATIPGGLTVSDIFPDTLQYLGAHGMGSNVCSLASNSDYAGVLSNHQNYRAVLCDGVPANLAPGKSTILTVDFKVQKDFTNIANYAFMRWKDGDEDDYNLMNAIQPGNDIIDLYNNGSLVGFNNMSKAIYSSASSGSLADTGEDRIQLVIAAAVLLGLSAGIVGLLYYRRVKNTR